MNLFHSYELLEKVYQDSQSQVNRAISKLDDSQIFIKTINHSFSQERARAWLLKEFDILCRFDAPNIIKVDKSKTEIDRLFIVLKDFPSQNLSQLIQQSISAPTFLTIAIQLASALEEIHDRQIVHGNIQPNCIAIDPVSWELTIVDFSEAIDLNSVETVLPQKLSALNLAYIAPEQTGRTNVALDCRTDFYALGVLLYRLITGELPYKTQDSLELIHYHLARQPLAPCYTDASVCPVISAIIMKLLAKNPDERYQSAAAIKADLQNCQTQYSERGIIQQFKLGTLDSCSKFTVSQQLYGRSPEFAQIAESVAQIDRGAARMLLIEGVSGIGKTALVERVVPTIVGNKGYFVRGRFEPSTSSIPYQGIIQALKELIRGLLKETSASRQLWQQKIQQALGERGKLMTDVLPELEIIIGSQPDLPTAIPQENQRRIDTAFVDFLQVFTRSKSHLVLFLDDLQWADPTSLNLIELLLADCKNQHLLIIGAYRQNEIDDDHSLTRTIERIARTMPIERIALQPLNSSEINSLLVDTFYCHPKRSKALAQLIFGRTNGNPFFIARLLETFYREQLITFDRTTLSWQWCVDEIRTTTITNYDVLELVCQNFRQLPPLCQQILKLAACIGNQFDLIQLTELWHKMTFEPAVAVQLDREAIASILDDALEAGIIILSSSSSATDYQFLHHRIKGAIYSSIEEAELSQLHLVIGQFLAQQIDPIEIESYIYEVVRHLNIARIGALSSLDINHSVELNLTASRKAKNANAYELAANYVKVSLELLPTSAWQNNYCLMLAAHQQAIEIEYLQGNFIHAEQLCNIVLTQAETRLDCVPVYKIKIQAHIAQNQMQLAVDIGLYVLGLLEIDLSNFANNSTKNTCLSSMDERQIESLYDLRTMTDGDKIAAMEIIATIIPPVYIARPQLLSVIVAQAIALSLEYGNCPLSAYAYAFSGLMLCAAERIETGYRLGKLALKLQQKFDAKEIKSKIGFLFNNMIRHWREPAVSTLDHFLEGIKDGVEVGDIEHACFHATRYCAHLFYVRRISVCCRARIFAAD